MKPALVALIVLVSTGCVQIEPDAVSPKTEFIAETGSFGHVEKGAAEVHSDAFGHVEKGAITAQIDINIPMEPVGQGISNLADVIGQIVYDSADKAIDRLDIRAEEAITKLDAKSDLFLYPAWSLVLAILLLSVAKVREIRSERKLQEAETLLAMSKKRRVNGLVQDPKFSP